MGTGQQSRRNKGLKKRAERKEKGICVQCGTKKPREGLTECKRCAKRYQKKNIKIDRYRKTRNCDLCSKIIFNKLKHSKYCKQCARKVYDISGYLNSKSDWMRKKYPELKIKLIIKVTKE